MNYKPTSPPERGTIVVPSEMEVGETYLEVFEHETLDGYDVTVGKMKQRGFVPRAKFQVSHGNTFFNMTSPGYPGVKDPVEQETLSGEFTVAYYEVEDEQLRPFIEDADHEEISRTLCLTDRVVGEVKSILEENGFENGE